MNGTETQNGNGNGKFNFTLPTFGCKGCKERKAIMGAGDWQTDIGLLLLVGIACVIFYKVRIA